MLGDSNVAAEKQWEVLATFAAGKEKLREAENSYILEFLSPEYDYNCGGAEHKLHSREAEREYLTKRAYHLLVNPGKYQWCVDDPLSQKSSDRVDKIFCSRSLQNIRKSIQVGREKV